MRRALALGLGLSLWAGCFGSFRLTGVIYDFNRDLSDNLIVQEVVFLAFAIVPVYEIAIVADAVVFNVFEAITGDNPISAAPPESRLAALPDGRTVAVVEEETGTLVAIEGRTAKRLVRQGQAIAILEEGQKIATVERIDGKTRITTADGSVFDGDLSSFWASAAP